MIKSHDFVTLPPSGGGVGDEFLKLGYGLSPSFALSRILPAAGHGRSRRTSRETLVSTTTLQS
jgi:hypothetical protein